MNFQPLGDRVLVKRIEAQKVSAGGIIIPDNAKEKPIEATVIAVGPGAPSSTSMTQADRMPVKEGDRVLFGRYSGTEIKLDDVEHLILRADDILGILRDT